jgi:hypothetical protein
MEMPTKRHQSHETKPTGTRRRFVSSNQLRNDIAVVAGIASSALHIAIK